MHWIGYLLLIFYCIELFVIIFLITAPYKKVQLIESDSYPMVSIFVAARNEEKYIRGCIQSLLALDYPKERLEIMLGNDHSEDNTLFIMNEYKNDSRVVIIDVQQPRSGLMGKAHVSKLLCFP